jgi:hypothetical protein
MRYFTVDFVAFGRHWTIFPAAFLLLLGVLGLGVLGWKLLAFAGWK